MGGALTLCDTHPVKLGELIDTRRRELGLTYDQVADKARSRGFSLSRAAVHGFANQGLSEAPRRRTMEAIAYALDVGYPEVVLAVAESLIGSTPVEVSNLQHVQSWLTLTGGRTDEEVASVLRVLRTVTAALDAAHGTPPGKVQGSGPSGDDYATSNRGGATAPPE